MKITFTTAPEEYDYGSTTVLSSFVGEVRGKGLADGNVRVVRCNDAQVTRYKSGCFLATHDEDIVIYLAEGIDPEEIRELAAE